MAKKQEEPKEPEGADVAFDFSAGELRTVEVKAPGLKPFSVTFKVPGAGGRADLALATAIGDLASRGEEMVRFVARHLVSWTLPQPAEHKSVAAIKSPAVLFALFSAIREAEDQQKNS
jgi:hypothetical protein